MTAFPTSPASEPVCLQAGEFDPVELMVSHPPIWKHPNKQAVFEAVWSKSALPTSPLRFTRWGAAMLPDVVGEHRCQVEVEGDVFSYAASDYTVWHVNFADPNLFVAYGSALLAQDELQVLEHPVLGSLREALLAQGIPAKTRDGDLPTPVLVMHAPRQCALDTFPDPDNGKPRGLYGNQFQQATVSAVMSALTILPQASLTNLIAIAAPIGRGAYTEDQIRYALVTAYTGMLAAKSESRRVSENKVQVNTGFWGCGAFGGNRELMSLIQLLAARLAGIDRLVFYTGSQSEMFPFESGRATLDAILKGKSPDVSVNEVISKIVAKRFAWGTSDGN